MRQLHLDFERVHRPMPWLGAAVLGLALAALGLLSHDFRALSQQAQSWERQADRLARESSRRTASARPLTEAAARAQMAQVNNANRIVRELVVPWNALFNAVDASGREGVALLALEPDTQKGTVKMTGEARDLEALLAYVRQLESCEVIGRVLLQEHQVQRDVADKPVRFSLLAEWKGAAS